MVMGWEQAARGWWDRDAGVPRGEWPKLVSSALCGSVRVALANGGVFFSGVSGAARGGGLKCPVRPRCGA